MSSKVPAILLLLVAVSGLGALEVQRGKLKLTVNDKSGRFTLMGAEDSAKPVWMPLFLAGDATTSKWKLQVNDKVVTLGDDPGFTTAVEPTSGGAKVTWTSKTVSATLTFDFLLSVGAQAADGLRLTLNVVNLSESNLKVGVRWVLDTNLGEKKEHFRLATGEAVSAESRLEGSYPDFYTSRLPADDSFGLLVMVGKAVTPPSRVVFANWKRLDDSPWDYAFKAGRDFNLLPYSFNDSAVAEFFDSADLAPGSTREVIAALGLVSAQTLVGARPASSNPLDDLLKKNQNPSLSAVDQDLASLETVLGQMEAKLADPTRVSSEDLRLLQAVLDQIEARRKALEGTKP